MFIVVKNPPSSPVQLSSIIANVVDDIYGDTADAQKDAINLANTSPGDVYVVFQLVPLGSALAPVIAPPPAEWKPANIMVTNLTETKSTWVGDGTIT